MLGNLPSIYASSMGTYIVDPHNLVVADLRVLVVRGDNELVAGLDGDLQQTY
jgi:hypothetical protein